MRQRSDLETEIAAIGDLTRDELAVAWTRAFGCAPPKGIKRGLLERSAAWHLQARRLGGLPLAVRKTLRTGNTRRLSKASANDTGPEALSNGAGSTAVTTRPVQSAKALAIANPPRPGSRLMREWNGRMHIVEVIDGGFSLDGKTYRSLSAVARRITGAQWSGPRFFGL
ncbi:DUF2924 domain-containing protein [Mesorhizobium sp. M0514]|uniref:DUF2924 domain-containing protein n=1 Tax=Mesorhizobium sp. M0514 TaxID=2956955 RepID=UPI0033355F1E